MTIHHPFEHVAAVLARLGAQTDHGGELAARRLVLELALILLVSGVGARIARRWLGQPPVVGQILAGIALGPSVLGAWWPGASAYLLPAESLPMLGGLGELGLVLLAFQVGLDVDFRKHLTGGGARTVAAVGACSFVVPLVAGFLAAPLVARSLSTPVPATLGFRMIFACAMAITAVPVLGRIFAELGIVHGRVAALSIGAAAINDVLGWMALGAVAVYVRSGWHTGTVAVQTAACAVGLVVVFKIVGPVLGRLVHGEIAANGGRLPQRAIGWILLAVCGAAVVSSALGVFALIGALLVGVALNAQRELAAEWDRSVAPLVQTLFVPLFFTLTGLRTDIGSLHGARTWAVCGLVLALAVTAKLASGYLAARASGEPRRVALAVGVAMNTRGLMELVALNIGLDLGVLPPTVYSMLVLTAVASTYIAAPLLRLTLLTGPAAAGLPGPRAGVVGAR